MEIFALVVDSYGMVNKNGEIVLEQLCRDLPQELHQSAFSKYTVLTSS